MFFQSQWAIVIVFTDSDLSTDQNNRVYDFGHNRALPWWNEADGWRQVQQSESLLLAALDTRAGSCIIDPSRELICSPFSTPWVCAGTGPFTFLATKAAYAAF